MEFNITDQDLFVLLDPYISKEELKEVWKEYVKKFGYNGTHKDIQMLSKKIVSDKKINPESIKSLFNPSKIIESKPKEWIIESCKELPTIEQMDQIEGGEEIIEDIKLRLKVPENTNVLCIRAVNSDHDAVIWCHTRDLEEDYPGYYHGMITCECHDNLPDRLEDLKCDVCKRNFKLKDLHRFPHINGNGDGGWEGCYCSYECLQEVCHMNDVRENIMCSLYFE